jgi:hypothetical protein
LCPTARWSATPKTSSPEEVREAGLAGLFLDSWTNLLPRETAASNGDFSNAAPQI